MRTSLTRRKPTTVWDFMNEMNSVFDQAFGRETSPTWTGGQLESFSPNVDIEETNDFYLLSFDLPGVRKEDIHIDLTEGRLTVKGERKYENREEKENGFRRVERSYGSFERSFQLPSKIDESKVQARSENGVLEIMIPKAEVEKPKRIEIETGSGNLFSRLIGKKDKTDSEKH